MDWADEKAKELVLSTPVNSVLALEKLQDTVAQALREAKQQGRDEVIRDPIARSIYRAPK